MQIDISLPLNRWRRGQVRLLDDEGVVILTAECLGKADGGKAKAEGNADRDPAQPWGDTPTGKFAPAKVQWFDKRLNVGEAWIPLEGVSGQALEAKGNGRTGLGIHAARGSGKLVATHGCVRMLARDLFQMFVAIGDRTVNIEIHESEN